MVDKEKITRYILELENYIKQLKEFEKIKRKDFIRDWKIYHLVERCLHLSIETFLSLGNIIISEFSLRKPDTYSDIPQILFENKILDFKLCEKLKELARFRNVLVHEYLSIDHNIVYDRFKIVPKTLLEFLENLKKLLKDENFR